MKQRRILRLLALVGVLTLIGAACSNDDGGSSGDSGSTGASGGGVDCSTVEFGCVEVASGRADHRRARCWRSAVTPRRSARTARMARRWPSTTWTGRSTGTWTASSSATPSNCPTRTTSARPRVARQAPRRSPPTRRSWRSSARAARAPRSASPTRSCPTRASCLISPSNTNPGLDVRGGAPAVLPAHRAQRQDPGRDRVRLRVHEAGAHDGRHDQRREPVRRRSCRGVPRELRGGGRHASRRSRRSTAPTPTSSRS